MLDYCSEGSDKKQGGIYSLAILVLIPVIVYFLFRCIMRVRDNRRKEREAYYKVHGHVRLPKQVELRPSQDRNDLKENLLQMRAKEEEDDRPDSVLDLASHQTLRQADGVFKVDFRFEELGLKLKSSGVSVLSGVTGEIKSGRVTAVMGPSGAGKSTFVTTLAGKSYYGNMTGTVFINNKERTLAEFQRVVGFVPQEDIMMRDLTVKENIWLAAQLRLPAHWPLERKKLYRDSTIHVLGLWDIRHMIIGDETSRGISGGQRKRVNIALEMVADPTVLFLDEPTSGLDSTSSMEVCSALRKIADYGLTIITVIHQPRYEIFCAFHDVLLLGKGGKAVYLGPSNKAIDYFASIGLECPARMNPPDFFMDVIAGEVSNEYRALHPNFSPADLFTLWQEHSNRLPPPTPVIYDESLEIAAIRRQQASWCMMTRKFMKRALVQQTRHVLDVVIDNGLIFLAAGFMSFINISQPWVLPPPVLPPSCSMGNPDFDAICDYARAGQTAFFGATNNIGIRGQMTCMAIGLTACASSIKTFGREHVVYWREAAALPQPKHTLAYFLGKDLAQLPQMLIGPFLYAVMFKAISAARGSFKGLYVVLFGITFAAYAVGYLVSVAVPPSMAQLVGVVVVFSLAMFDGAQPTIPMLAASVWPLNWHIEHISFLTPALRAFYSNEASEWIELTNVAGVDFKKFISDTFGYTLDTFEIDVGTLFVWGIGIRLIAFILMHFSNRSKKL